MSHGLISSTIFLQHSTTLYSLQLYSISTVYNLYNTPLLVSIMPAARSRCSRSVSCFSSARLGRRRQEVALPLLHLQTRQPLPCESARLTFCSLRTKISFSNSARPRFDLQTIILSRLSFPRYRPSPQHQQQPCSSSFHPHFTLTESAESARDRTVSK